MPEVTFDEPQYSRTRPLQADPEAGSIIGLMYKLGIAKTKNDANIVMGGIVVVCLVLSVTMFIFVQPHADPVQAQQLKQDAERLQAQQFQSTNH